MDAVRLNARQALSDLYSYHDQDLRFTRRLDSVVEYIDALEAAATPAAAPEPTADVMPSSEGAQADATANAPSVDDAPLTRKGRKQ